MANVLAQKRNGALQHLVIDGILVNEHSSLKGLDYTSSLHTGFASQEALDATNANIQAIPDWAKDSDKPTYTANEVGALPNNTNYAGSNTPGGGANSLLNSLTIQKDGVVLDTFDGSAPKTVNIIESAAGIADWAKQPNKPTYDVSEIEGAASSQDITAHDTSETAHSYILNKINSLENQGGYNGAFDTLADRPTNTSDFPNGIHINDYINIRSDSNYGGATTRYIVTAIDSSTGVITWTYDLTLTTDASGKQDSIIQIGTDYLLVAPTTVGGQPGGRLISSFATAAQGVKADTAYQKPSTGIPATDMTSSVQSSLAKADSALQGTAIANWAKQPNKPTYTAGEVGALPSDTMYAGSNSIGGAANSTVGSLSVSFNGTQQANYNGSANANINITPNVIGAVTHSEITDMAHVAKRTLADSSIQVVDVATFITELNGLTSQSILLGATFDANGVVTFSPQTSVGSDITSITIDALTRTITLTKSQGDPVSTIIPQANSTTDGFMTSADVITLADLRSKVDSLIQGGVWRGTFDTYEALIAQYPRLNVSSTDWTSNDYIEIVADESPTTDTHIQGNTSRYTVVVSGDTKTLVFNRDIATNVPIATNESLGMVRGIEGVSGSIHVESDGSMSLTGYDYILTSVDNKVDKLAPSVSGNIAGLDMSGQLIDTGKRIGDFASIESGALAETALQPDDISDWAKATDKPIYTASEVGALPNNTNYAGSTSQGGAANSVAHALTIQKEGTTLVGSFDGATSRTINIVETDPTIHPWAKTENKPTYTKSEIGLGNVDNTSDANKPLSSATQEALSGKENIVDKGKAGGYAPLDSSAKVPLANLPDVISVGGMVHAGEFNANTYIATLTDQGKSTIGTTAATIALTNDTTDVSGYLANQNCYYPVSTSGTFAGINYQVGDWLTATASGWSKIDNTDEIMGVKGDAETTYRLGYVNITPTNIGLGNVKNIDTTNASNITSGSLPASLMPTNMVTTDTQQTISAVKTIGANMIANSQTITPTQLGYLSGVTSNIQNQINNISSGVSNASNLTTGTIATGLLPSDVVKTTGAQTISGNKTFSGTTTFTGSITANSKSISATELGYLDGVTSAIQTQLSAKVDTSTAQTVAGVKTFSAGAKRSGTPTATSQEFRNIYAGTTDLTAGSSSLTTGTIYIMYE